MALTQPIRTQLHALFTAAVAAVDPRTLIARAISVDHDYLLVHSYESEARTFSFPLPDRVFILGAGKGAGLLAQGLEAVLGARVRGGAVVIPTGVSVDTQRVTLVHGEHPLPGPGSVSGAEHIRALLTRVQPYDLLCFCLTGGASSLLVSPAVGLSLADKLAVNRLLLACGADIHELNTVRKHLSQIKGGHFARLAFPTPLVSFILSDVIDDDLSTIGSGPTVPDASTFQDAWSILERYRLLEQVPTSVRAHLAAGCGGMQPETPKPGDAVFAQVRNFLLGSNRIALAAAAVTAKAGGLRPVVLPRPLIGDTTDAARQFAAELRHQLGTIRDPVCVLAGGETTVRLTGQGKGGRNQEFALVVAQELAGEDRWTLLSAGTDGIDGPTDAAGAFVDGHTVPRAQAHGLDPVRILAENDSYRLFTTLGDLFSPGPTGTNVMDLKIALLFPSEVSLPAG
ncbi:MAG: glycerate kinase [Deltaproteobacteria bacterium]|nr:glycerate kinase [Deltaproteobacteria bacterium]